MEPETCAAAKRNDSDDDQNAPDSSSIIGKKTDQDQQFQILVDAGDTNWYKSTQALKYLQPVFMPIVKDKIKSLQLQAMTDFGRQLCAEATAEDIILVNGSLAHFKHLCPGTEVACQNLLNIIKGHTRDSANFYKMLKGTDPQHWLKAPFEFVRLFLKDWMKCDIHDFQECDITALCTIVKNCKPLMQMFDEGKIDQLRKVRNRTMHPATMSTSQQEMENNIDVILDFLEHIKSLKSTVEVIEVIESIKQLKTGDVRLLYSMVMRLIEGWLPGARRAYEHKRDQANNLHQDIIYMENKLARLSSGQEMSPLKQSAEHEFGAKIEKLTDESQTLKQTTEELAKLKEEKRELEKQNEELRKLRQEESEEWSKKLKERLHLQEPHKRTTSGGEPYPTQALSASTSSDAKRRRMSKEVAQPQPLLNFPRMPFPTSEKLDLGPSPATGFTDVSTIPVKSDKDKGPCHITGMVAISGTQLMLADKSNKCIKLLDLETGTVIGVKELLSAPRDVTRVPGSMVAVTIPAFHQIHVFSADQNLDQCRIMGVDGICLGIHCSRNKYFVSFKNPPLVQIMNMAGDTLKTIKLDSVEYPQYLTCSLDNEFIYVSDFYNDNVTCMDRAGSEQWGYNCRHYTSAGRTLRPGVCTGDGNIYICSDNMIHVVSRTGTTLAVIPLNLKEARSAALCYNSQERTLYVSRFRYGAEENNYISRIPIMNMIIP